MVEPVALYVMIILALCLNARVRYRRKYPRRFSCLMYNGVPDDIKYIDKE